MTQEAVPASVEPLVSATAPAASFTVFSERLEYATTHPCQFIDVSDDVRGVVERSGVGVGQVLVSSAHTTAAVVVQEHEPLLLRDMARLLQRIAPADDYYEHNDFTIRTVNMADNEPENGHSHCQHLFLGASETLPIVDGAIQMGMWQSIFLVELDNPPLRPEGQQRRRITVQVMGLPAGVESA